MKTAIPIIFVCLLFLVSSARYKYEYFRVHTNNTPTPEQNDKDNSNTFYITGTGVDTSMVLVLPSDDVALEITCNDTSASGDSVDIKVVIMGALRSDGGIPAFSKFIRKDSVTVTNESTTHKIYLNLNDSAKVRTYFHLVELTGGSDNKILSATSAQVIANFIERD